MSKFVALPIEVKVRDFQSRLLLSLSLLQNNFEVIIGSQDSLIRNIDYIPQGIYFDKSLSKNKIDFFKKITSMGFSLVSQDEEGLCSLFNYERYITQRICPETLALAEKVFTWGNSEAMLIKERYPEFSDKVVVTGNPRIDLLCEPFKAIHHTKSEQHKQKYQEYFLFPSSFTVNHAMGNENIDNFLIKMGRVQNNEDLENYHIRQEFFRKTFIEYSSLIEETAITYPDKNLIVRPHPSEDAQHWHSIARRYDNVFIESEGNIASWIMGSELVIHSSCTTGMEAFIMRKPVISFLPYTDHEYSKQISNTVSKVCQTNTQVKDSIDCFLTSNNFADYSEEESRDFLRSHIKNLELVSCEAISKEISQMNIAESNLKPIKNSLMSQLKNYGRYLKQRFSNPKSIKYAKQKLSGISSEEINELISDLRNQSEYKDEILCSELTNDLFHLKRKP